MNIKTLLLGILMFPAQWLFGQSIKGKVQEGKQRIPLPGVAIQEKGTPNGVIADENGQFNIDPQKFPCVLVFSFIGYDTQEINFPKPDNQVVVLMQEPTSSGPVLDIRGERISEKVKQGPLTIETLDLKAIKSSATGNFYESLGSLKGVDLTTASLGFRIINTRGFNSTSPVRTLQIIDGVDNQSPGLNFSLGNFLGAPDLDVKSVEIIQGASGAYYGPGAFNGVVSMETKNPFLFKGASAQLKVGERSLTEMSARWADAWKNKAGYDYMAFKVNVFALRAYDWEATNYDPTENSPNGANNPGRWDAVNMYGDEYFPANDLSGASPWNYKGIGTFYRTGYNEKDLVDYNTKNYKANLAAHWRLKPELEGNSPELVLGGNVGGGTTVYQGDNRFSLKNILFYQGKIELNKKDKYFVRIYATGEDAGNSYDPYFTAMKMLDRARSNEDWAKVYTKYWNSQINPKIAALGYPELELNPSWPGPIADPTYSQFYLPYDYDALSAWTTQYHDSLVQWHQQVANLTNNGNAGLPIDELGYYQPGTAAFDENFQQIISAKNNKTEQGTRFSDRSSLFNGQAQYQWEVSGWQMKSGVSGRVYRPYSLGTIFSDSTARITTHEMGFYHGVEKHSANDDIIVTATIRADKNKNFNWIVSPAASLVLKPAEGHYIRYSFSSALRNPTLTDQYLHLNIGPAILSGNLDGADSLITLASFGDYRANLNVNQLQYFSIDPIRPERVKTFEVGYRGAFSNRVFVDLSAYMSHYRDFIGYNIGLRADFDAQTGLPSDIVVYRYAANAASRVTTQGVNIGVQYYFHEKHTVSGNYSWNQLVKVSTDDPIVPAFNTPKNKFNLGLTGEKLWTDQRGNEWGYSINYKWIQGFIFEGSPQFTGYVPTYDLVDAQVNYQIKKAHLNVKLGASNLLNNYQFQTYGGPRIGRLAYLSLRYEWNKVSEKKK
jgi:outer membrane receptor protein involved in Fe transport